MAKFLGKKHKNIRIIMDITHCYINFLQKHSEIAFSFSDNELIELFRYSLCQNLGLESVKNFQSEKLERLASLCRELLSPKTEAFVNKEDEFKQGLVQGCMLCITASFDNAREAKL